MSLERFMEVETSDIRRQTSDACFLFDYHSAENISVNFWTGAGSVAYRYNRGHENGLSKNDCVAKINAFD